MLSIRRVQDDVGFGRLEPAWNRLLQASRSDSFFLTWEWLSTWWRHYRSDYRLLVLVAEEGGELVGLAPLMIGGGLDHLSGRARRLSRQIRFLKFLSQGETCPEHMDFICQPGREEEVIPAFVRHLAVEDRWSWDILSLVGLPAGSPNREPLLRSLAAHRLAPQPGAGYASPYLSLPSSVDAFWQSRSTSFRKKWRYYDRALAREGTVKLQLPDQTWPVDRIFDELLRLNEARFRGDNKSFISDRYKAFHRELCHLLEPRGWLFLCLLTVGERPVAARYDFVYAGKAWSYQGGWSQDLARISVGNTLLGYIMEHCIQRGLTEYDFLAGEYAYKRHWGNGERQLIDVVSRNPYSPLGWLFVVARRAQAVVRQELLPRLPARWQQPLRPPPARSGGPDVTPVTSEEAES